MESEKIIFPTKDMHAATIPVWAGLKISIDNHNRLHCHHHNIVIYWRLLVIKISMTKPLTRTILRIETYLWLKDLQQCSQHNSVNFMYVRVCEWKRKQNGKKYGVFVFIQIWNISQSLDIKSGTMLYHRTGIS